MRVSQVFAFGSNLDITRMRRRCPSAVPETLARLPGHRLAFAGHSAAWGGAVATAVPARGRHVDGLIYRLARADLERLDRFEGTPYVYVRVRRTVVGKDGQRRVVHAYVLVDPREERAPPPDYLGIIARAYGLYHFSRGDLTAALVRSASP